jgi:hypothetical protein
MYSGVEKPYGARFLRPLRIAKRKNYTPTGCLLRTGTGVSHP